MEALKRSALELENEMCERLHNEDLSVDDEDGNDEGEETNDASTQDNDIHPEQVKVKMMGLMLRIMMFGALGNGIQIDEIVFDI